ncbi:MAG TPA: hypothetical protein VHT68_05325 [Pseudolabrys sp.]|nr:hypothetical protein [Pseudolabrys sp.]
MNVLGGLLYLSGACALLFGIGTTIWPVAMFGFTRRQEGVFVIVAALLAMGLGQMMIPVLKLDGAAAAAKALAAAQAAARSEALHNIRTQIFSLQKVGGDFLKAAIVIHNDNDFPVKDVVVTCKDSTNSSTKISGNGRTVYQRVEPRSYVSVANMTIGPLQSDGASPNCEVTGFAKG